VRENVLMGAWVLRRDRSLVRQRYQRVVETLPVLAEWADRRAGNLSGGQRRLVEFARFLRMEPTVVLLDEPSLGLDPASLRQVYDLVRLLNLAGTLATGDLAGLRAVPPVTLAAFVGAGLIHFSIGWTFLNASQMRIGAARTSPLLAATPLFGTILAVVTLGEVPGAVTVLAMALIVAGVYVTVGTGASPPQARPVPRRRAGGAPCWGSAPPPVGRSARC
jgi:uncharacterized membrane protein